MAGCQQLSMGSAHFRTEFVHQDPCQVETIIDVKGILTQNLNGNFNSHGSELEMHLDEALKLVQGIRQIDPEMPLQQAHCFLIIAEAEDGLSLSDIAKKANIGLATASRYVAALGKLNRHREEGLQIIEAFEDPMERRKKIIRLTHKGKLALNKALGNGHDNN